MTLPASGAISFNAINVELGVAGTTSANINQASYRTLAGVPSGAISLASFYGKANQFSFSITTNQTNANLRTLAVAAGWNGTSKVVATINSGIYVYSTSTGTPGLTVDGSWPGGIFLTNNGYIQGQGGNGGNNGLGFGNPGSTGGPAISLGVSVNITNNSYIGGGGGGGGSAVNFPGNTGGGGAGNGLGGSGNGYGPGASWSVINGKSSSSYGNGGNGGGTMPGVGGDGGSTASVNKGHYQGYAGSAGGGGGGSDGRYGSTGNGGSGGAAGGAASGGCGAGGGGWGASGGSSTSGGGAGGKAINLNGFTATFAVTGTVYGAVS